MCFTDETLDLCVKLAAKREYGKINNEDPSKCFMDYKTQLKSLEDKRIEIFEDGLIYIFRLGDYQFKCNPDLYRAELMKLNPKPYY